MAKANKAKKAGAGDIGYEAQLWQMTDALRNNRDAAEYKLVSLSLFFLKFTPDAFEAKHAELTTQKKRGAAFINHFKEVQRLKTQLDQYTDLSDDNAATIEHILPKENLVGFRGAYLETAQRLKLQQGKGANAPGSYVDQLEFEFVLFASSLIDYDYIMGLIARFSQQTPGKQKMSREQLVGLIQSDAKFMNEREDIAAYIATLKAGEGLSEKAIRDGYTRFKAEKETKELADIAAKHGLAITVLQGFVDIIMQRMIFDGEQLTDLMEPLGLNWKARRVKELDLMNDLLPLLTKRAQGRDISGLSAYEQ